MRLINAPALIVGPAKPPQGVYGHLSADQGGGFDSKSAVAGARAGVDQVKGLTVREMEELLMSTEKFSRPAARMLAGRLALTEPRESRYDPKRLAPILRELRDIAGILRGQG